MAQKLSLKRIGIGLGIVAVLVTALFVGTRLVTGQSLGDLLGRSFAAGAGKPQLVAWVNEEAITLGQYLGVQEALVKVEQLPPDQAPQAALNRLVRQTVLQLIAQERGLAPTPQEVEERLALLYQQAAENPEMRAVLEPQAQAQGMVWDSEEFKALLRGSLTDALAAEHLNQQALEQAGGDVSAARQQIQALMAERYSSMKIRIEVSNLSAEARNIHIPGVEELTADQLSINGIQ